MRKTENPDDLPGCCGSDDRYDYDTAAEYKSAFDKFANSGIKPECFDIVCRYILMDDLNNLQHIQPIKISEP